MMPPRIGPTPLEMAIIASLMPINLPRSLRDTISEMLPWTGQAQSESRLRALTYMIRVMVMIATRVVRT